MAETSVHGAIRRILRRPAESRQTKPTSSSSSSEPRDLISDLPDAVIHHIFSFLPLRDVVKTSVLSKRWRSAWTATAHLVFDDFGPRHRDPYYPDFPSLVDSVLIRCSSPAVKRFHITIFKCDEAYRPNLDLWLRSAEGRCVEDLRLCLHQLQVPYKLPRYLYCLSRLVRLEIGGCCFSLGTAVRWPCLKVLSIRYAELSDDILEGIVRGSPVLESLGLYCCRGVKNIVIDSTSVKELILVYDHGCLSNLEKIWSPNLLSLRVLGIWCLHSVFRLDNISSLVEAEFDFLVYSDNMIGRDLFKELLEKTRGVSTITIGCWCLQILSAWEMEGVASPLSKCQNLILRVPFELDKKSIKRYNFDEDLLSWKRNFQCLVKHLKRVEIIGFANNFGSKHLLALIKFLLGDALVLEKMIIKAALLVYRGQEGLSKLVGVSRNVLSYQRASQNAKVIFDYPLEEVSFKKHMKKIRASKLG